MIILLTFAFLAGIATIAAPCILPILPIVLSAGVSGGRKRPFGIICGLIFSFGIATLGLSYLVGRFGVNTDILRYVAIVILIIFGLVMIIPKLLIAFEIRVSKLIPQTKQASGDGFWSGVLVGISLGLVWAPCTGPIMASVIALSATRGVGLESVAITLVFVIGAAIPLSIVMYGSRAVIGRLKKISTGKINPQTIFGVIMILTAMAIWTRWDQKIQVYLLDQFPRLSQVLQVDNRQSVKEALKKL